MNAKLRKALYDADDLLDAYDQMTPVERLDVGTRFALAITVVAQLRNAIAPRPVKLQNKRKTV